MIDIRPIPAFDDNYIWLLWSSDSSSAVVVDPGNPEPVREAAVPVIAHPIWLNRCGLDKTEEYLKQLKDSDVMVLSAFELFHHTDENLLQRA